MSFVKTYENTRMPTTNPCDSCRKAEICDQICIDRARWWDRRMKAVKEALKREKEKQKTDPPPHR